MFDWLKSKPSDPRRELRDTLFGGTPLTQHLAVSTDSLALEPWASFRGAKQLIDSGDPRSAIAVLKGVLEMPHLESRQYLQAHHFLRELGVSAPAEKTKDLLVSWLSLARNMAWS